MTQRAIHWGAAAALMAVFGWAQAEEFVYAFDLVKQEPYRKVWQQQVWQPVKKKQSPVYQWLNRAQGVSSPMERTQLGQDTFYQGTLCQPHNCGNNMLYVLINRHQAVGIQYWVDDSGRLREIQYGSPNAAQIRHIQTWRRSLTQGE